MMPIAGNTSTKNMTAAVVGVVVAVAVAVVIVVVVVVVVFVVVVNMAQTVDKASAEADGVQIW